MEDSQRFLGSQQALNRQEGWVGAKPPTRGQCEPRGCRPKMAETAHTSLLRRASYARHLRLAPKFHHPDMAFPHPVERSRAA